MVVPLGHTLIIFLVINYTFGERFQTAKMIDSVTGLKPQLYTTRAACTVAAMFGRVLFSSNDPQHFGESTLFHSPAQHTSPHLA